MSSKKRKFEDAVEEKDAERDAKAFKFEEDEKGNPQVWNVKFTTYIDSYRLPRGKGQAWSEGDGPYTFTCEKAASLFLTAKLIEYICDDERLTNLEEHADENKEKLALYAKFRRKECTPEEIESIAEEAATNTECIPRDYEWTCEQDVVNTSNGDEEEEMVNTSYPDWLSKEPVKLGGVAEAANLI